MPGGMDKLFANLERFGDAIAVVDESDRAISFAHFLAMADASAASLGSPRRLVAIELTNRLAPLAAYVGAIRAGHAAILLNAGGESAAILQTFEPNAIYREAEGGWSLYPVEQPAVLHRDLAVLLSTSGSTGSPKLVRLSHMNLVANAGSIIEYLGVGPDEAAITTLPPAYSYGLSVIHSHLLAGARLVLFEGSVADPAFADRIERHSVTSFAGVPHTYELLERTGFDCARYASLRAMTQAGGRLGADKVRAWAAAARGCGKRFFVMYGQTEAGPRMAYLPPDEAERFPDCIGHSVPGGSLRIEPVGGGEDGELIYAGPNVMMGYALQRDDLARGPEISELRTGDLARRNADGHFQITGRISRFSKAFGLRISLDEVEARLAEAGLVAAVAGDDEGLVVAASPGSSADAVSEVLQARLGLPRAAFQVAAVKATPRLASGKTDYAAILVLGRAPPASPGARPSLKRALAELLGVEEVKDGDSFISLGGDSLNYVRTWLMLEERLGQCPEGWEMMTVAELEGGPQDLPARRMAIDADVLTRAFAIVMVVAHHVMDSKVGGGAASLLLIAGMNFSRFQTPKLFGGQFWSVLEPVAVKALLPYFLIITGYFVAERGVFLPQYLLVSNFTTPGAAPDLPHMTIFWYIETYVWLILAASLLMLARPVRRLLAASPWTFSLSLLLATVAVGALARIRMDLPAFYDHTPISMAYLFAFGWAIPHATTRRRKALLAALGAVTLFALERPGVEFAAPVTLAALALLLFVRKITLGWKLTQAISITAGASLYIYLSHGMAVHAVRALLGGRIPLILAAPAILACCLVGIGVARLVDLSEAFVLRRFGRGGFRTQPLANA